MSIEYLFKKIIDTKEKIEREQSNLITYNNYILEEVNNELKELHQWCERVNTVEKFATLTNEYNLEDIQKKYEYQYRFVEYSFKLGKTYYGIDVPLKYLDVEELTYSIIENQNYLKFRLYKLEDGFREFINYFSSIEDALHSIKENIGGNI